MLFGAHCAQEWWRIYFGGNWGVRSIGGTRQQLCIAASCLDAGKCCVTESSLGAGAAVVNLQLKQCLSMGGRRRNGGASVLGANRVPEASEALSSSFALRHHAWMQANAVPRRAAWVLVLRSLTYRVSDAVSAHVAAKLVAASCSDACECCVAESSVGAVALALICGVSDAVSAHVALRSGGASVFGGRLGRLPRMEQSAAMRRYRITPRCWQTLSRREQRGTVDAE